MAGRRDVHCAALPSCVYLKQYIGTRAQWCVGTFSKWHGTERGTDGRGVMRNAAS